MPPTLVVFRELWISGWQCFLSLMSQKGIRVTRGAVEGGTHGVESSIQKRCSGKPWGGFYGRLGLGILVGTHSRGQEQRNQG